MDDDEKKCFCPNCNRETVHVSIPYLGFRCMTCFQWNKKAEYENYQKKLLAFVRK